MSYHTCLWSTEPGNEMAIILENVSGIVFNIKLCFNFLKNGGQMSNKQKLQM